MFELYRTTKRIEYSFWQDNTGYLIEFITTIHIDKTVTTTYNIFSCSSFLVHNINYSGPKSLKAAKKLINLYLTYIQSISYI